MSSLDFGDAGKMAEMPERTPRVADGIRKGREFAGQESTAQEDVSSPDTTLLIEQMIGHANLLSALKRVETNKGAAGSDGMSVSELRAFLGLHWKRIKGEILAGDYRPTPVRRVEIPKSGGGVRLLGIPTALDRFIQQALTQVLVPVFDPTFSESSYGFRPGRSAHQAVASARNHVEAGYRWVVDMDLEKFFDRVNHDVLMSRVARRVKDKRVLKLIRSFLEAGVMLSGVVQFQGEGTPQGGPLSPLLSNILLDDLDKELESRGHRFCRYADDCNVYVRSKASGERVMESLTRFLASRLRLRVNPLKSAADRPWNRKFLGYSMTVHFKPKLKVALSSLKRLKAKLREIFRKGRGRNLRRVIAELNEATVGWVRYFRLSQVKGVFEELDQWLRRKLRCILWRQWKKPKTRFKKLVSLGLDRERARTSAGNGRGPWWNAGASHMNACIPVALLAKGGLVSLLDLHRRIA
jgi:RNA-directed DNA polymerase